MDACCALLLGLGARKLAWPVLFSSTNLESKDPSLHLSSTAVHTKIINTVSSKSNSMDMSPCQKSLGESGLHSGIPCMDHQVLTPLSRSCQVEQMPVTCQCTLEGAKSKRTSTAASASPSCSRLSKPCVTFMQRQLKTHLQSWSGNTSCHYTGHTRPQYVRAPGRRRWCQL